MAFDLWIDGDVAWAQGRHEYRPLGCAVIAVNDLFRARDFRPRRREPSLPPSSYVGLFASLGQVNDHLRGRRRIFETQPSCDSRSHNSKKNI